MAFKPFASFEFAGYQITLHICVLLGAINNDSLDICVVFEVTTFQVDEKADSALKLGNNLSEQFIGRVFKHTNNLN